MSKEIRRRASVVCIHDDKLLTVRLQDPVTRITRNFPPGGMVEASEEPWEAAAREAFEETGYDVNVDRSSEVVRQYPFQWGHTLFQCETHFYRAELVDPRQHPRQITDATYNLGYEWIPLAEMAAKMNFHTTIYEAIVALTEK